MNETDKEFYERWRRGKLAFRQDKRRERRNSFIFWVKYSLPLYLIVGVLIIFILSALSAGAWGIFLIRQEKMFYDRVKYVDYYREDYDISEIFYALDVTLHVISNETDFIENFQAHFELTKTDDYQRLEGFLSYDDPTLVLNSTYVLLYLPHLRIHHVSYAFERWAIKDIQLQITPYNSPHNLTKTLFSSLLKITKTSFWLDEQLNLFDTYRDQDRLIIIDSEGFFTSFVLQFNYWDLYAERENLYR